MQHPDEGMIHAWIDGALDAESARELESHIAMCEDCARLAAEARGLVAASSRILTALDNVPDRVIPVAGARAKGNSTVMHGRLTPFWMRTAAAIVIVAGASALVMTGKLNSPERKVDLTSAPVAMEADSASIASDAVVATQSRTEGRDMGAPRAAAPSQRLERLPPPQVARKASSDAFATTAPTIADARVADAPKSPAPGAARQPTARDSALEESRRAHVAENVLLHRLEERLKRIERADTASLNLAQRQDSSRKLIGDVSGVLSGAQTSSGKAVIGQGQGRQGVAAPQRAVRQPSEAVATAAAPGASRAEMATDARVSTLPGCYALSLSPWSGGTIPFGAPPARIELDSLTSLQESIRGLNLVHPGPGAASNRAPLAYWRVVGDSVHITWRDDQRGVLLKLPLGGEVLIGLARTFTLSTANEPTQTSAVEARRISCR